MPDRITQNGDDDQLMYNSISGLPCPFPVHCLPFLMSQTQASSSRRLPHLRLLFLVGAAASAGILVLFFYKRSLNLDEGWYLMAAKLVGEGRELYIDFSYTQGPVMPYAYNLFFRLVPLNLPGGRGVTLFFAALTWMAAGVVSWRLFGVRAALMTLVMLIAGLFATAQYVYVATYALTGFLLVTGIAFWLASDWKWRYLAAGVLLALAAGVRISVLPTLPIFFLALLLDGKTSLKMRLSGIAISLLTLALIFGPFLLRSPELVWYNLVGFHTDRITLQEHLLIRQAALRRSFSMFAPFWLMLLIALIAGVRSWRKHDRSTLSAQGWLLVVVMALFVAHLIPRTADAYYNTLQYPLMSILMGAWLATLLGDAVHWFWKALLVILLAVLFITSQSMALQHYQLFRWDNAPFRDVARWRTYLDKHVSSDCKNESVTFTPLLAIEGKTQLAPGLEMGMFSYRPTWDVTRSKTFHAVNNELLTDLLRRSQVGWAAFSDYDFNSHLVGNLDDFYHTLYHDYRPVKTFLRLGAAETDVTLFLRPGCLQENPAMPLDVAWTKGIDLRGLSWESLGDRVALTFWWQAAQPVDTNYTVFIHLLDEKGKLVYGHDEQPCRGLCPTTTWRRGELIRDEHLITPNLPPGRYQLEFGLYDANVQRLPLAAGGDAYVIPLDEVRR